MARALIGLVLAENSPPQLALGIAAAQRARWVRAKKQKVVSITLGKKKRKLSANVIAKIRAAQKKRWAQWRKSKKKSA